MSAADQKLPEKITPKSASFTSELAEQLARLVPEAVADGKIDFDKLKAQLENNIDSNTEKFGIFWPGKSRARNTAVAPTSATLKPREDISKEWDNTKNIFIEGDNLEVLKVLQGSYRRSIKMIYIDPPYNKGKDFIYPDNYQEGLGSYLQFTGQLNESGEKVESRPETIGRKHSKWLSMMYPRLQLAKSLLTIDGLIFISIDDIELHHLLMIMNEVFGSENRVGIFKWNKTSTPPSLSKKLRHKYEYVVCYQRSAAPKEFNGGISSGGDMPLLNDANAIGVLIIPKNVLHFNFDGRYPAGTYDRVELLEAIDIINGQPTSNVQLKGPFKWTQANLTREISEGTTFIIKSEKFAIRYIRDGERFKKPSDIISKTECGVGTNEDASKELEKLFGVNPMSYPKPTSLISYLATFITRDDDIILDFFSGSGTTGHAIMQLNLEDGGSRSCIEVQLPEPTYELDQKGKKIPTKDGKAAFELGFETIAELAIERLNRAGEQIASENSAKIAARKTKLDIGYKVYELAPSNFIEWDEELALQDPQKAILQFADNQKTNSTPEQLLTEILLRNKIPLETQIKKHVLKSGDSVYISAGKKLIAYVDSKELQPEQAEEIATMSPQIFVALDSAFKGNDALKINVANICKDYGIDQFKTI